MTGSNSPHTIGVAMSGGVDSTVTAGLLLEQRFAVEGFFMLLPLPGLEEQVEKVRLTADRLDIPLHLVDLRREFTTSVMEYFVDSYRRGLTPNPCVICNRLIKCGLLMETVLAHGLDMMATGHYARIDRRNDHVLLRRASDPAKDQSYFLCRLSHRQLGRLLLPLGGCRKKEVFAKARDMGFTHFGNSESQDVCFLTDCSLSGFLKNRHVPMKKGDLITTGGEIMGRHEGIWKYTVGQRRGLGIPDATPWYVVGLDAAENRVIIGKNEELFRKTMHLHDVTWNVEAPRQWRGLVQLRSRHQGATALVRPDRESRWQVVFDEPQRAVTPGQFAVFYENDMVIGSGVIIDCTRNGAVP
jgi:tRNA-specific 2-thiouridylase